MKITAINIENVRGFKRISKLKFSNSINVFLGSNNSGKSTILNSIYQIQAPYLQKSDITIGEDFGRVELYFEGIHNGIDSNDGLFNRIGYNLDNNQRLFFITKNNEEGGNVNFSPTQEPNNLIYPYLSKRKTNNYQDVINENSANSVLGNFSNLYSKIDRLVTPQFRPANQHYIEACNSVLGFEISTIAKGNGKHAVYYVYNLEHIPLTSMGEGVANIIGLITDLCVARDKIFLIEEPENDIHPKALKALLKLIIDKSDTNQFFISTHSNIVMKYLGGVNDAKIFNVTNEFRDKNRPNLFLSSIAEIPANPEIRRQVLEDLGYDFFDFDLWKGWLFLEESSAEIIIRDYLIDWFVKPLKNKIRTFSAGGVFNVITKFEDFDRLFVFLHMEPTYKNKVWVVIDNGQEENAIIEKLKDKYSKSGWNSSNFSQFQEHDFEKYYPSEFQEEVSQTLAIEDKAKRRLAKTALLEKVKYWIQEDEETAKLKFRESAKEVIDTLKNINRELNG
ncbi:MAG: AAA family ATPase [Bacteroidia bacterium]|jgi:AAA15 family ATPase/GTPase|nr:AAA family ATPase [Bacteroidia bacterium]